ncbi:response regulator [Saliphagus sp. LR7]|uniref:response regulator n=1 Tax=Saliphagus sp. LR7 TaxID=2282654 RepID=UPI000DF76EF7|nr:response regulator [Saliphagus sp. LR7]
MHQGIVAPASGAAATDPDSLRVLHVDDDASHRKLTRSFLEREGEGIVVETAPDAGAGSERLEEGGIDCIVSDYEMPGTDGLKFLECVREDHPEIPFVLFTGRGSEEIASEAISAGVTDYLQKGGPEQYRVLANRVTNAVERHRAHVALAESRRQFATFLDNFSGMVYRCSPEPPWNMSFVGGRVEELTGYPPEALERGEVAFGDDLIAEADAGDLAERVRSAVDTGESFEATYRIRTADGERRHVWEKGTPIVAEGEVVAIEGCLIDVTERQEREAKIRGLQTWMDDLIRAESRRGVAEVAVRAAEETLDLPLSGVHLREGEVLEPVAVTEGVRERLETDSAYRRTDPDRTTDRVVWDVFERGESLVIDDVESGEVMDAAETPAASGIIHPLGDHGVFITSSPDPEAFDDTDEALVEILATTVRAALDRTGRGDFHRGSTPAIGTDGDRLEAFAGALGHDLRNPLGVAAGHLELAGEQGGEHVTDAARAVERSREIVADALALARGGRVVEDFERVRIADLAARCWDSVETAGITLRVESEAVVLADRSRLSRVVENLFRNAVEHGSTSNRSQAPDDAAEHGASEVRVGDLADGFYVEDDGPGVAPADRERVFEVGYSTAAEGTGFGLGIVREIVEAHGWSVRIGESEAGGARFSITDVPLR